MPVQVFQNLNAPFTLFLSLNGHFLYDRKSLTLVFEMSENMTEIIFRPVGLVHTSFKQAEGTPIQPILKSGYLGRVEVFHEYAEGLKDLEGFSHIILICYLHKSKQTSLLVKPYMDDEVHGVFATRGPARPNPIGISVVELLGVNGNELLIDGSDILDGTPLLDIKPYVAAFDHHEPIRIGWLENRLHKLKDSRDDGRFV